jgi:hypothetical protein
LDQLISDVVNSADPSATQILSRVFELQQILNFGGAPAGAWLSVMRNQLNYQHRFGVWYPYSGGPRRLDNYTYTPLRLNSSMRLDHSPGREPLLAFQAATTFVVALCIDLTNELLLRSGTTAKQFGRPWQRLRGL